MASDCLNIRIRQHPYSEWIPSTRLCKSNPNQSVESVLFLYLYLLNNLLKEKLPFDPVCPSRSVGRSVGHIFKFHFPCYAPILFIHVFIETDDCRQVPECGPHTQSRWVRHRRPRGVQKQAEPPVSQSHGGAGQQERSGRLLRHGGQGSQQTAEAAAAGQTDWNVSDSQRAQLAQQTGFALPHDNRCHQTAEWIHTVKICRVEVRGDIYFRNLVLI